MLLHFPALIVNSCNYAEFPSFVAGNIALHPIRHISLSHRGTGIAKSRSCLVEFKTVIDEHDLSSSRVMKFADDLDFLSIVDILVRSMQPHMQERIAQQTTYSTAVLHSVMDTLSSYVEEGNLLGDISSSIPFTQMGLDSLDLMKVLLAPSANCAVYNTSTTASTPMPPHSVPLTRG